MTVAEIAGMLDIAAVQAENTHEDLDALVDMAGENGAGCVMCQPAHVPYLRDRLAQTGVKVPLASVVGFPGGAETTRTKELSARELIELGCDELDMVNNVAWLKAGEHDKYVEDVRAVVRAAGGRDVKVILECHWLTDEEIVRACNWCVEAGAAWVKTGTGWTPTGATAERVALMKKTVGDRAQVKAAGGVRSLETLMQLYDLGARRFGIGVKSARKILDAAHR